VYNNLDPLHIFGTEDLDFIAAMYGEPTVLLSQNTGDVVDSFHGRNQSLREDDEDLPKEIFSKLSSSISALADPYSDDGSYASAIHQLPIGLRSMAATHHLDVSLTLDDIGWHFLNFGELNFVRETESGLHELGLGDIADWFAEAFDIVNPLRREIESCGDYYECLKRHGRMERISELTNTEGQG
jgi:hypothetical protein